MKDIVFGPKTPDDSMAIGVIKKVREIIELRAACLECLPLDLLQLKPCLPKESTSWPHLLQW